MGKATKKRTTTPKPYVRYKRPGYVPRDVQCEVLTAAVSIRPSDAVVLPGFDYGETDVIPQLTSTVFGVAPSIDSGGVTSDATNVPITHVSPLTPTEPSTDPDHDPDTDPDPDSDNPDIDNFPPPVMNAKMRRLTDMAMVTELVVGTPLEVIAKNYNVDIRYAQRLRSEWMKACKLQETMDYRHELKVLSLEAVRDGLKSKADPFKRANIGIRSLQGIGEFKPDTINLNVLQRLENVPPELRGRFITSSPDDEAGADAGVLEAEIVENEKVD